jgi:hypothetical protein
MIFFLKKILAQNVPQLKNNFHVRLYGNIFKILKSPNSQHIFWKTLYLYLNKYLEHTKFDIKTLFVVKTTWIFWLIHVNIN